MMDGARKAVLLSTLAGLSTGVGGILAVRLSNEVCEASHARFDSVLSAFRVLAHLHHEAIARRLSGDPIKLCSLPCWDWPWESWRHYRLSKCCFGMHTNMDISPYLFPCFLEALHTFSCSRTYLTLKPRLIYSWGRYDLVPIPLPQLQELQASSYASLLKDVT